jgi:hypothetical protein
MINATIGAALEALFSKCASISYFFMVLSHSLNAGLISVGYPLVVFGYALMEEGRPGKRFWQLMTYYTIFILFMKFIAQLKLWDQLGISDTYR